MRRNKESDYSGTVTGTIIGMNGRGIDFATSMTVEYVVNNVTYTVTETIKLKSEPIKIGFLTVGQNKMPKIGNIEVGSNVTVKYDPSEPEKAFIEGNSGIRNV